jgi:hypothetical protein
MSYNDQHDRLATLRASTLKESSAIGHPSDGHGDDVDAIGYAREAGSCEATAMPRPPLIWPDFSNGMLMVALDCRTSTSPEFRDNAVAVHLGMLIGRMPFMSPEDFKMGAVIADHLGLGTPPKWLEKILGLTDVDRELKRAIEAALCGLLATTVAPFDLAATLHALGTFIHAHPYFSEVTKDTKWVPPYGKHTAYEMAWFDVGSAIDEPEADAGAETDNDSDHGEDER